MTIQHINIGPGTGLNPCAPRCSAAGGRIVEEAFSHE